MIIKLLRRAVGALVFAAGLLFAAFHAFTTAVDVVQAPSDFSTLAGAAKAALIWIAKAPAAAAYGFGLLLTLVGLATLFWEPGRELFSESGNADVQHPNESTGSGPRQDWMQDPTAKDKLELVVGRHFRNCKVKMDGKHFNHCTFENATLLYNGGPMALTECTLGPLMAETEDAYIHHFVMMMVHLGIATHQMHTPTGMMSRDEILARGGNRVEDPPTTP